MTDKLTAGLARLRELERDATPGPWPAPRIEDVRLLTALRNVAGPLLDVADTVPELLALIDDMSRFAGQMALNNYQRFNEAPIKARRAIAALATAMETGDG